MLTTALREQVTAIHARLYRVLRGMMLTSALRKQVAAVPALLYHILRGMLDKLGKEC